MKTGLVIVFAAYIACNGAVVHAADAPTIESTSSGSVAITATDVMFRIDASSSEEVSLSSVIKRLDMLESENAQLKERVKALEDAANDGGTDDGDGDDGHAKLIQDSVNKLSERVDVLEKDDKVDDDQLTALDTKITAVNTSLTSKMLSAHAGDDDGDGTMAMTPVTFTAKSFGHCTGVTVDEEYSEGAATFTVNGDRIDPDDSDKNAGSRGIHVVAFNPEKDHVKLWYNVYDTCCGDSPADENKRLVTDITKLPEGTVVLAAISDEGVTSISAAAVDALEMLGSQYIRHIASRESWAIIGRVGAVRGSTSEDHGKAHSAEPSACQDETGKGDAPNFAQRATRTLSETFYTGNLGTQITNALQVHSDMNAWHREEQRIQGVEISVQSVSGCAKYDDKDATYGVGWWINGLKYSRPTRPSRGFNFITLQPMTLAVGCDIEGLGCPTFDTYSGANNATGKMFDWINNLPVGTVVAGGIVDEGTNRMNAMSYTALDMLGCSIARSIKYREGYALIGTKGDTKGSAIEDHGTTDNKLPSSDNEKKCTGGTDDKDGYDPRPTRQLRRVYFQGQSGLKIDEELGRRAGAYAVENSIQRLGKDASRNIATIDIVSQGACIGSVSEIVYSGKKLEPETYINDWGHAIGTSASRGILAAAFAGDDNRLLWCTSFDTYGNVAARAKLNDALVALAPGSYIAAAVSDAHQSNPALLKTMASSFGATMFKDLKYRESWAFIAQKGGEKISDDAGGGVSKARVLFEAGGGGQNTAGVSAKQKECTTDGSRDRVAYKPIQAKGSSLLASTALKYWLN